MKLIKIYTIILLVLLSIPVSCFAGEWTTMQSPFVSSNVPGSGLHAVWGSAADNVYAVGTVGTILHYDGSAWSIMNSPTTRDLNGIWGRSGNDIFAVGSAVDYNVDTNYRIPTILHYDGTTWGKMSALSKTGFGSVWGTPGGDLFVAGAYDPIYFDGNCWSYVPTPNYFEWISAVWGFNSSDVYAVGTRGTILHYDGSVLTRMDSGTTEYLWGIWGSSGSDVFAVGGSTILHYDGNSWTPMASGTTAGLWGVWGSSARDVFAVGGYYAGSIAHSTILHYNGSSWSPMISEAATFLYGIWGSSGSDIFAVGSDGVILHYSDAPPATTSTTIGPASTTTIPPATTTTTTIQALPGEWIVETLPQQTISLLDVWGSSGEDVFAVGFYGTIVRRAGNSWHTMDSATVSDLFGIWGSSENDIFTVGSQGTILHYDGNIWSPMESGAADYFLTDVWGSSAQDVFAVGLRTDFVEPVGIILHYDGTVWTMMATKDDYLTCVWGTSGNDVYASGEFVPVMHYDGSAWSEITDDRNIQFNYLWGTSANSLFASRNWGEIDHYDGICWTTMIGLPLQNVALWGSSDNDLFAVGKPSGYWDSQNNWVPSGPNVHHYDGNAWSPVETRTLDGLNAVWGSSATNVFAVGEGLILHYSVPTDSDNDGLSDAEDNCPQKPNGPTLGTCMPGSDKAGAACTSDADCVKGCSTNGKCSVNQEDTDHDGWGDVCDNCPVNCNLQQLDADGDGKGDVCDSSPECGRCSGVQCEQECYPYTI
jgi:hypothetical protein